MCFVLLRMRTTGSNHLLTSSLSSNRRTKSTNAITSISPSRRNRIDSAIARCDMRSTSRTIRDSKQLVKLTNVWPRSSSAIDTESPLRRNRSTQAQKLANIYRRPLKSWLSMCERYPARNGLKSLFANAPSFAASSSAAFKTGSRFSSTNRRAPSSRSNRLRNS